MANWSWTAGIAAAAMVAAPAAAQAPAAQPTPASASAPLSAAAEPSAAVTSEYRIGRDDTLQIAVFQVPELSQTVQVDANGEFILPLIGRVPAAGRTAGELADQLRARLDGRYLRDPQVTVVVKTAVGQRVTVNGAVVQPGVYPLSGSTSLVQALALAKGADARIANRRRVAIFRTVDGRRETQVYNLLRIERGQQADPVVQADDIIIVDTSGPRSFLTYFGSVLPILASIRP